ncbi:MULTISPECIES: 50S ribosomal protein L18Ae [Halorussus]|uniref:50S ribosomal protein L18Ae n=1 Tax=Halorussus TaxID=1070314 RepID=UPI0020A061C2|nr:50S ribosomal protein L18Ae [Halorussus vallis]USZ73989.1 50S ribosomal protein L18Ae [Halorussus vallis]
MSEFTVRGRYQDRDGWRNFETSVEAENENVAREHAYANFGGRHGLKRTQLEVEEVEAR